MALIGRKYFSTRNFWDGSLATGESSAGPTARSVALATRNGILPEGIEKGRWAARRKIFFVFRPPFSLYGQVGRPSDSVIGRLNRNRARIFVLLFPPVT
jgi:hypothetical protein